MVPGGKARAKIAEADAGGRRRAERQIMLRFMLEIWQEYRLLTKRFVSAIMVV